MFPDSSLDQLVIASELTKKQWLPNQLSAVMDMMISIYDTYLAPNSKSNLAANDNGTEYSKQIEPMMETVRDQREKLAKEVERWCKERGV
jgi:indoleamine 2,3-dioxygenase